ncbi:STAS domain-containing protein [Streptomyces katrae]|uniref:STAS domain-containing protein n=1 Tax=Streptomyces katrae TaxID=68223 RepID=UPI00068E13CD|nr:STAS domain-containing protein [Streptomyces katrae]
MNDGIRVTMSHDPEGTVITVAGELDMDTCPTLHQATAAAAANGAPLHLDLVGVPFMDVFALHLLLDLQHDFQRRQASLTISGFQRQPTRLLTLTSSEHLQLRCTPPRNVVFPPVFLELGSLPTPALRQTAAHAVDVTTRRC